MTQLPEAYKQAKKHILFQSQQKSFSLNCRMNSANKAICYAEVINMYSLHELFRQYTTHCNGTYNAHWY